MTHHFQRLMRALLVVEPNPVSRRMLQRFKPLPVNTLLLDRSNDSGNRPLEPKG